MANKRINYPGVGEVLYVKSRRARKFTLTVRPWRGARVTLPWFSAYRDAEAFVKENIGWIQEKIQRARIYEKANGDPRKRSVSPGAEEDLRLRARACLPGRTAMLAKEHGFTFRRVTVRRSRTRWGSCSAVNNINLSIFLMNLPEHLIDYVILHELVHTVHKNHSGDFWALLDKHTGGRARALAAEIRKHRITI
ncbi:MAG: DUF45 domain-containing protein [Marinilabiliales bacterium]|nr:MAG: DUF45 domain-containing protein [Marinilabiliales bacterium]